MAVKPSGSPLSLSEIQTEFGGSNPISLSEYYRGGGLVPNGPSQNANIAASGAISMSSFYGSVKAFVFSQTLSTNTTNYNLRSAAIAAGWDQVAPLQASVTINSGIYVSANSTGTYAFDTGASFPAGSTLALTNNGFIVGMGGAGGAGAGFAAAINSSSIAGSAGGSGGGAFRAQAAISVVNNGTIAGGGGGGGGGANLNFSYSKSEYFFSGGGGGGGRSNPAASSSGGAASTSPSGSQYPAGAAGTTSSAGSGGVGGELVLTNWYSGFGGNGGSWGAAGASGTYPNQGVGYAKAGPYSGGSGGAAVAGNSNITWTATGTRLGAIA